MTEPPVDVEVLRDEIRRTYSDVSTEQDRQFIFPTGRAWAQELGYPDRPVCFKPSPPGTIAELNFCIHAYQAVCKACISSGDGLARFSVDSR